MKANLDKAGDQKYIAVKDSAGDEYTNWEKTTTYFSKMMQDRPLMIFRPSVRSESSPGADLST